jgi:hypothetical protein
MGSDGYSSRVYGQLRGQLQKGPVGVPMINGVPLVGDISLPQLGLRGVYYDKTENWNLQRSLISQEGAIYIYSDYKTRVDDDGNEIRIPNMKIGDGTTPLIDAPFIAAEASEQIIETIVESVEQQVAGHVAETVVQTLESDGKLVTTEDRENWNAKLSGRIDPDNPGNLILSF